MAGAVALTGDVDPVDATVGGLLDELVVVAVVHDPGEPSVKDVGVGETLALLAREVIKRDADAAGFAKGVLGGIDNSDLDVELWATVAGVDDDRLLCEGSEGLEDFFAQLLKELDVLRWYAVVDAKLGGSGSSSGGSDGGGSDADGSQYEQGMSSYLTVHSF